MILWWVLFVVLVVAIVLFQIAIDGSRRDREEMYREALLALHGWPKKDVLVRRIQKRSESRAEVVEDKPLPPDSFPYSCFF